MSSAAPRPGPYGDHGRPRGREGAVTEVQVERPAAAVAHLRREEGTTDVVRPRPHSPAAGGDRRIALVDLLDRVLAGGVVIAGEVTLSIADVDLVHVSLRTLISSVSALQPALERAPDP
jgi:hypothetical protein